MAEIGIHHPDDPRRRDAKPIEDRCTQTQFSRAMDDFDAILRRQPIRDFTGTVGRIVVDDNHFERVTACVGRGKDGADEFFQPIPVVVGWNDHCELGRRRRHGIYYNLPARPLLMPATRTRYVAIAVSIVLAALALRVLWLRADPPSTAVGIVWHDEGAWVHNARNAALWGTWRTDNWNPVFIAPVFTAAEYAAFRLFGVGTWQARTVPVASGLIAIVALMAGLFSNAAPGGGARGASGRGGAR